MDAYTLIGRVDDEGFERLQAHEGIRYVARTIGSFSAFVGYEVDDIEALGRIGRDLDQVTQGSLRTVMSVSAPMETSTSVGIPPQCVDLRTLQIDWDCVGYEPPRPSYTLKPSYTAFAVCTTARGSAGDGASTLRISAGVRAYCELSAPGAWLAELGADDPDDLVWAVDQLSRGDVFVRVRSGVVVRGRGRENLSGV